MKYLLFENIEEHFLFDTALECNPQKTTVFENGV